MPRYAIAFYSSEGGCANKLVEMDSVEAALQYFFTNYVDGNYTKNQEGYNYFKEDFNDPDNPLGSILEI